MTRYPKKGKATRWTNLELQGIRVEWAGDVLSDGDGLTGTVRLNGDGTISVRWRYSFRWMNKLQWFYPGTWPGASLADIRRRRDEARELVRQGVNPITHKRASEVEAQQKIEAVIAAEAARRIDSATLKDMFDDWIAHGVRRADGNVALRSLFEHHILEPLGSVPVRTLTDTQLRGALSALVKRGTNRTAHVACTSLQQMFRWSEKRAPWRKMLSEGNPADLLEIEKITSEDYDLANIRTRVLSADELKELWTIFARLEHDYETAPAGSKYAVARPLKKSSELALWICLGTLTRIGETLKAEWRDVDLEARTWHIPAENTKGKKGQKRAITIALSDFTVQKFESLREISGKTRWLFPARDNESNVDEKSVTKQVGDRQLQFKKREKVFKHRREDNSLVLAKGANGEWTPHDLRRTGATIMQALGIAPDVIDRCQNHAPSASKVRRAYQRYDYALEMKEAWIRLGEHLGALEKQESLDRQTRPSSDGPQCLASPTRRATAQAAARGGRGRGAVAITAP